MEQQISDATKNTLANFRKKAAGLPFSAHPYSGMRAGLEKLGKTEWDDEHKKSALSALVMWVVGIVGQSAASTMNEIVELMRIAVETENEEHKKAADEMASSMSFLEAVFGAWMHSIDFDYIATQLFEDGQKLEKERADEEAAAEAAKAKVKAFAEQKKQQEAAQAKSGTVHRCAPSVN
jgi:hypothetical protein